MTDIGFRSRAVSLLHSSTPFRHPAQDSELEAVESSNRGTSSNNLDLINEKSRFDENLSRDHSASTSNSKTLIPSADDVVSQDKAAQRLVRTVPGELIIFVLIYWSNLFDRYRL